MLAFFMSRCAGETPRQYQDRIAEVRIPQGVTNRPYPTPTGSRAADGIGYFYPDGTLYGYISTRK